METKIECATWYRIYNNEGCTLAADVDLVAYGLGKNVTSIQLSNFLQDKGIDIIDCKLLTKFEGARSLSFKITVKPQYYEKVKDPTLWSYRVGLRMYKHNRIPEGHVT